MMSMKHLWYRAYQLSRYEKRYGALNPEARHYALARESGRQSHFYDMACVAVTVRLASKYRSIYRFGSSGRAIHEANVYGDRQEERNELAREVRAMTVIHTRKVLPIDKCAQPARELACGKVIAFQSRKLPG